MTADDTIEATPGQAAAYERDGFLVVAGPTRVCPCVPMDYDGCDGCPGVHPVPTTKPCPKCGGDGCTDGTTAAGYAPPCPTCNGDGTAPITVEVVVPERPCPDCDPASNGEDWCPICMRTVLRGHSEHHAHTFQATARDCWLPARTILRGSPEAVPVVEFYQEIEPSDVVLAMAGEYVYLSFPTHGVDVTHHFADVPRPEVGGTSWVVRP